MFHFVVQVNEFVSSNLNSMVTAATNPVKILSLFQRRLQDYIILLQGDLTKARRQAERLAQRAVTLDRAAAEWTAKAQTAMDHKREDLARAALLTREQTAAEADEARAASQAAGAEADELGRAIAELEAKLAETNARLAEERSRPRDHAGTPAGRTTRSERVLDSVATMGQRVDFATENKAKAEPSLDSEIEQLRREAKVSEELAAMKAAKKPAPAKKAKPAKRAGAR